MKHIFYPWTLFFFFVQSANATCSIPKPTDLHANDVQSCSVTMEWDASPGAAYYVLWYEKKGTTIPATVNLGINNSYVATGLLSNKQYNFKIEAFCSDGTTKGYTALVKVTTLKCSVVTNVIANDITTFTAIVSWDYGSPCHPLSFKLRYRISSPQSAWTTIQNIDTSFITLASLHAATSYEVQIASNCSGNTSTWSPSVFFHTLASRPNILFILEDDGRYDTFPSTGGPSFFQTPAINRIADEGINFRHMLPATSQCTPSRCSFYTGLYPHKHGATTNSGVMIPGLPLIQQILHDNGYYTGFVGKYGLSGAPPGFDWYAKSNGLDYYNPVFTVNGTDIPSNDSAYYTQVIQDYALRFLDSVPQGKPFLLYYFPIIPHFPTIPSVEEKNLFENEDMPFPINFYKYNKNYPSYLYHPGTLWPLDSVQTDSLRRGEFQTIKGMDYSIDTLFQFLESKGILDSTLILFSSDNGYLKGEHLLEGKEIMYEESIRLPMFIRYPKWFTAGTVVNDEIASNLDVFPMLLEAAGITDTFNDDGVSMHQLATHAENRKYFLCEFPISDGLPAMRAVCGLQYKYIKSYCGSTTEEFYNLTTDPHEDTNQINKSSYATLIETYRIKLDSLRTAFSDVSLTLTPCFLRNVQREEDEITPVPTASVMLFPNPTEHSFEVSIAANDDDEISEAEVFDLFGRMVTRKVWEGNEFNIDCSGWSAGSYVVEVKRHEQVYFSKLTVLAP